MKTAIWISLAAILLGTTSLVVNILEIKTPEDTIKSHRQLEEYQVSNLTPMYGWVATCYYLVLLLQILGATLAAFFPSDKVFWLTGFSIHMQILFLLGSFQIIKPGYLHSMVTHAGFQSVSFFGNGDLHLDLPSTARDEYLNHNYTMLKAMAVSPFIFTHRVAPVIFYLCCFILSALPKFGVLFYRLRVVTLLNYLVHMVYFSITTFGATSHLKSPSNPGYVAFNVIIALLILGLVTFDCCWLVVPRSNKLVEIKNLRKVTFDITKPQLFRLSHSIIAIAASTPDLWYGYLFAFFLGIFGETGKACFFFCGILIMCHMASLARLLVEQSVDSGRLYACSLICRLSSQFCLAIMLLILGMYQFGSQPFSAEKSKSTAQGFAFFWVIFVLGQFATLVSRFIIVETIPLQDFFKPKDYGRMTRLPMVDIAQADQQQRQPLLCTHG